MVYYNGEHAMTFYKMISEDNEDIETYYQSHGYQPGSSTRNSNIKHTWYDWHLIPTSRPCINPPSVKTKTMDLPGSNSVVDLTTVLTGSPAFSNRTGSFEFIVVNQALDKEAGNEYWTRIYSEMMNFLQGQWLLLILWDDPGYFYKGRFGVNSLKSDMSYSTIVVDYDLYPYKKIINSTQYKWLWDPFDFDNGYINDVGVKDGVTYNGYITVHNGDKFTFYTMEERVVPKVIISNTNFNDGTTGTIIVNEDRENQSYQFKKASSYKGQIIFLNKTIFRNAPITITVHINGQDSLNMMILYRGGIL